MEVQVLPFLPMVQRRVGWRWWAEEGGGQCCGYG
jgi:hypothetical protein